MFLNANQLIQLSQTSVAASMAAGQLIASYADAKIKAQHKPGGDSRASQVVTEVDVKSQEVILNFIEPACQAYDLALLTEERTDDGSRFEKDYFWCVDPLDGTLPFVEGLPGYAVSIALVSRDGVPMLGTVYHPPTQTLYHAIRGQGAFRNNRAWSTPARQGSANKLCFFSDLSFLSEPFFNQAMDCLRAIVREHGFDGLEIVKNGGGVMNALWVLEHPPACYFKFPKSGKGGGSLWDYSATACIAAEAGLPASDIFGDPPDLNRRDSTYMNHKGVLFASDPELAKEIVAMYGKLKA